MSNLVGFLLMVLSFLVYKVSSVRDRGVPESCVEPLFANPNDCNSYYVCLHGRPKEMPCPITLHWNDRLKVCDWPHNANCKLAKTAATGAPSHKPVNTHGHSKPVTTECSITEPFLTATETTATIIEPIKPSVPVPKPSLPVHLDNSDLDMVCFCN